MKRMFLPVGTVFELTDGGSFFAKLEVCKDKETETGQYSCYSCFFMLEGNCKCPSYLSCAAPQGSIYFKWIIIKDRPLPDEFFIVLPVGTKFTAAGKKKIRTVEVIDTSPASVGCAHCWFYKGKSKPPKGNLCPFLRCDRHGVIFKRVRSGGNDGTNIDGGG